MRWTPGGRSSNLEDRRAGGGGFGMPMGIGGSVIVLVLSLLFGRNLFNDVGAGTGGEAGAGGAVAPVNDPAEEQEVRFVSFVLDDAQQTWAKLLPAQGVDYHDAKLVLFRNGTQSGCGPAQSAMGPFYCPLDEKVYIDLGFYNELSQRFGASGDFAQAYVLAHEIGHHVQHLIGTDARVRQLQEQNPDQANALSVRLELQADCYAGVWGHSTAQRKILEEGDVEEGLTAASAVGDDRIQQQSTGHVNVDAFTHGSAQQRATWFRRGLSEGRIEACDTFGNRAGI